MSAVASLAKRLPRLSSIHVENVRVLVRTDLAGPWPPSPTKSLRHLEALENQRLASVVPTLQTLLKHEARIIIASHFGDPSQPETCLAVAEKLASLLNHEIRFPDEVLGDGVRKLVNDTRSGQIVMLENLYLDPGELKNDSETARAMASLCDVYINDSLSICQIPRASTVGLASKVSARAIGLQLEHEIEGFLRICEFPTRPIVVIAGGPINKLLLSALQNRVDFMTSRDCIVLSGDFASMTQFIWEQRHDLAGIQRDCIQDCKRLLSKIQARDIELVVTEAGGQQDSSAVRKLQFSEKTNSDPAQDSGSNSVTDPKNESAFGSTMDSNVWIRVFDRIQTAKTVLWLDDHAPDSQHIGPNSRNQLVNQLAKTSAETGIWGSYARYALSTIAPNYSPTWSSMGADATLTALSGRSLPGLEALLTGPI